MDDFTSAADLRERADLHRLVDELPPGCLADAEDVLEAMLNEAEWRRRISGPVIFPHGCGYERGDL